MLPIYPKLASQKFQYSSSYIPLIMEAILLEESTPKIGEDSKNVFINNTSTQILLNIDNIIHTHDIVDII
jgi:hypothetical protein